MSQSREMPFGAKFGSSGCDFALWAPSAKNVQLLLVADGSHDCRSTGNGWWQTRRKVPRGTRYQWLIDGDLRVPDPASRFNPDGPHEASEVLDPTVFSWKADAWKGRPWNETVFYQLHIGTFTAEGTFAAAMGRLAELAEIGITAIQLMPVACFGRQFGWGYDSVLLFAPNEVYGSPDELKEFVDAAHLLNLMVFLDVVYNHFGPDGNFLPRYAPQFDSRSHQTPWGTSLNFDGDGSPEVREFMIRNAVYWLGEFRVDGLRLDAVHAMVDDGPIHVVEELTRRVHLAFPDRIVHVILENDDNNPRRLGLSAEHCEGQWNGDFHHCIHVLITGETSSYLGEYADDPVGRLGRVLTLGFSRQGPQGARQNADSTISLVNSVNFLQCHDQIGNRAFGKRLSALGPPEALRLAAALLLLSPPVPMLFMGEEYASRRPFLYFSDAKPELQAAVRAGRREEFRDAPDAAETLCKEPPDPCSRDTFLASVIESLDELDGEQRSVREWTCKLLHLRQQEIVPALHGLLVGEHEFRRIGQTGAAFHWRFQDARILEAVVNLGPNPLAFEEPSNPRNATLMSVGQVRDDGLGPWSGTWAWRRS